MTTTKDIKNDVNSGWFSAVQDWPILCLEKPQRFNDQWRWSWDSPLPSRLFFCSDDGEILQTFAVTCGLRWGCAKLLAERQLTHSFVFSTRRHSHTHAVSKAVCDARDWTCKFFRDMLLAQWGLHLAPSDVWSTGKGRGDIGRHLACTRNGF